MSERSTPYAHGTPSWVDMVTSDRQATMGFYRGLFGWDYEVGGPETGNYTMSLVRGKPVAGFGERPPDMQMPVAWTTYLATDDLDESLEKVTANGGQVVAPIFDVQGPGRGAVAADPTGAMFGLWEAGTHIGSYVVNEPGTIIWNEVATRAPDAAGAFYQNVFGHRLQPMEGFPYTLLQVEGRTVGGLYGMDEDVPADVPPHWVPYFAVEDLGTALNRVDELGGRVVGEPTDSEFGRWATVSDPLGATFRLIQPPSR